MQSENYATLRSLRATQLERRKELARRAGRARWGWGLLSPPAVMSWLQRAWVPGSGLAAGAQGALLSLSTLCSVQRTPSSWSGPPTWRSTMKMCVTCWGLTPSRSWRWAQTRHRQVGAGGGMLASGGTHSEIQGRHPEGTGAGSD